MKITLHLVGGKGPILGLLPNEAVLQMLHLGQQRIPFGRSFPADDEVVEVHQPLIVCGSIDCAREVERLLQEKLVLLPHDRRLDEMWRAILIAAEIACTCGTQPHYEADRELFKSLQDVLAG